MKNIPIGELLLELGYIDEKQLGEALTFQKNNPQNRLGDVLIQLGFVTETQKLEALATRLDLVKVDLDNYALDINAIKLVPQRISFKYSALPVHIKDGMLVLAMSDPLDYYAIEDIKSMVNMPVEIVLCEHDAIMKKAHYFYAEIEAKAMSTVVNQKNSVVKDDMESILEQETADNDEFQIVKIVNTLLIKGYHSNVSDIHIEPFENHTKIRMRIDGTLIEYLTLDSSIHQSVVARIKIISNLDIAEQRMPQDGHFRTKIGDIYVNVRTSVIPTVYGEKVVLRYLTTNIVPDKMDTFGMDERNYKLLMKCLSKPHGIIYITGPTGSGKTTTLYMLLEHLAKKQINISTIEDPVEKNLENINQMQVNVAANINFDTGLRALLRQDPDVIMIGETRDSQTAQISVQAAITGHLVFSTLHTNDALSTVVRLRDMGVESYLIANAVVGVVAQRLVKKICPNCKEEYVPEKWEIDLLGQPADHLYRGKGCPLCNQTGFNGRHSIHEVAMIDAELRDMISMQAEMKDIYEYTKKTQGMKSLKENCVELVLNGVCGVEELLRL